jgi:hypothetical protein
MFILPEFEPQPVQLVAIRSTDRRQYLHFLIVFFPTTKRLKICAFSFLYNAVGVSERITRNDTVTDE